MTEISIRDYIDTRLRDLIKTLDERFKSQETAIRVTASEQLREHERQNAWRAQFGELERTLMPRHESKSITDSLAQRLAAFEDSTRNDVQALDRYQSASQGAGTRTEKTGNYAIMMLGSIPGLTALIIELLKSHP